MHDLWQGTCLAISGAGKKQSLGLGQQTLGGWMSCLGRNLMAKFLWLWWPSAFFSVQVCCFCGPLHPSLARCFCFCGPVPPSLWSSFWAFAFAHPQKCHPSLHTSSCHLCSRWDLSHTTPQWAPLVLWNQCTGHMFSHVWAAWIPICQPHPTQHITVLCICWFYCGHILLEWSFATIILHILLTHQGIICVYCVETARPFTLTISHWYTQYNPPNHITKIQPP